MFSFLHFLISLIKFTLWNSGKAQEAKVFLQTEGRQRTWGGGLFWEGPKGSCLVASVLVCKMGKIAVKFFT